MKKILLLLLSLSASILFAQKDSYKVNQVDLIRDLQKWNKDGDNMELVFWIPQSYWRITLQDSPSMTEDGVKLLEDTFEDYVLVWVADIKIKVGEITHKNKEDLINNITLTVNGKTYKPLSEDDLSGTALAMAGYMKPVFSKILGQFGEGIHPVFFKRKDDKGNILIDAEKKGAFTIQYKKHKFDWKLPLPSLLPPKYCPVDKEMMKGNWNYCPIHGVKLD